MHWLNCHSHTNRPLDLWNSVDCLSTAISTCHSSRTGPHWGWGRARADGGAGRRDARRKWLASTAPGLALRDPPPEWLECLPLPASILSLVPLGIPVYALTHAPHPFARVVAPINVKRPWSPWTSTRSFTAGSCTSWARRPHPLPRPSPLPLARPPALALPNALLGRPSGGVPPPPQRLQAWCPAGVMGS